MLTESQKIWTIYEAAIERPMGKIYYIIGTNERGPWNTTSGFYSYSGVWSEDVDGICNNLLSAPLAELTDATIHHQDKDSIVISDSAEYTLVISLNPVKAKALYKQYNEDTGTEWN